MKKLLYLLPIIAMVGCTSTLDNPVLTIEGGQVQGVPADISGVFVYRGIPYALPPSATCDGRSLSPSWHGKG